MEVAVHLPQPMGVALQPPPPLHQRALYVLEDGCVEAVELGRIRVEDAHDALVMTDQLSHAPHVERGIGSATTMDVDQVVTEPVHSGQVARLKVAAIAKPLQVPVVFLAGDEFVQDKEFLDVAD